MTWTSYKADIEDKAIDNKISADAFANGTAGAAGMDAFLEAQRAATALKLARRAAVAAHRRQQRMQSAFEDKLAWRAETADVQPLRRKR